METPPARIDESCALATTGVASKAQAASATALIFMSGSQGCSPDVAAAFMVNQPLNEINEKTSDRDRQRRVYGSSRAFSAHIHRFSGGYAPGTEMGTESAEVSHM